MTASALFESDEQRNPLVRAKAEAYHRDPRGPLNATGVQGDDPMTDAVHATIFDETRSATPGLWSLLSAAILGRAMVIALGLGSVLTLANQADSIFGEAELQPLPLALVYATPFIVVTISQLLGVQRAVPDARRDAQNNPTDETFLSTAITSRARARRTRPRRRHRRRPTRCGANPGRTRDAAKSWTPASC